MKPAQLIVDGMSEELIDYFLVKNTAMEMEAKLRKKRREGKREWYNPHVISNTTLLNMLYVHLSKGDMIDVINIAAMIRSREIMYPRGKPNRE